MTEIGDAAFDRVLAKIEAGVLRAIRSTLVEDETRYQREQFATADFRSLWSHSARVAVIARTIAAREGLDPSAAAIAGLLHDAGKFREGLYHAGEQTEEQRAVELAGRVLAGSEYELLLPEVCAAIMSLYREGAATSPLGAALHDADRIDKLGSAGIAQFFGKSALRGRFLDDDLIVRASVELTYALHADRTLKTATGRELATRRSARVRSFFEGLIEEWRELGMGSFVVQSADVEGIELSLVVPERCACGCAPLEIRTDIKEGIKCRSAVIEYACAGCGSTRSLSFCLPALVTLLPVV